MKKWYFNIYKKKIRVFFTALIFLVLLTLSLPASAAEGDVVTADDFAEATIGLVTGATQGPLVEERFPDAEIKYFIGLADVIAALDAGQIDCTVLPYFSAIQYMSENPNFALVDENIDTHDLGIAFAKNNQDADKLRRQMNEFIAACKVDGTLKTLEENWFGYDEGKAVFKKADSGSDNSRKLIVCTSGSFKPFSYIANGKPAGYDIDFITAFGNAYGYDVKFEVMEFDSILMAVNSGQCDFAASHLSITPERAESVNFSDVYAVSSDKIMYKTGDGSGGSLVESLEKTFIRESRWLLIVKGLLTTILITLSAGVLGTLLAALICLLRHKGGKVGNSISDVFVRIFQGTPVLVILLIFFYVIFAKSGLPAVAVAIIVFSLNSAAFFSESIMSGIRAVPSSQTEAALALGFSGKQAFRLFVIPQAASHFLPVYRGELINLLKGTSVVGYIAIQDLTKAGDLIRSSTFEALFPLLIIAVIYFLLSWLLYRLLNSARNKVLPVPGGHHLKGVKLRNDKNNNGSKCENCDNQDKHDNQEKRKGRCSNES